MVSIFGFLLIIWFLLGIAQKVYSGWSTSTPTTNAISSINSNPKKQVITNNDEQELRERINNIIVLDQSKKSIRSLKEDPSRSNTLLNSSPRMGAELEPDIIRTAKTIKPLDQTEAQDNMIIGPMV